MPRKLILMSTLIELIDDEFLIPYEPELGPGELPLRSICLTPGFVDWVDNALDQLPGGTKQMTLRDEAEQILDAFVRGDKLTGNMYKIKPEVGLWKLHTPNLRMCGAIVGVTKLVLVSGHHQSDLHGKNTTKKYASIHKNVLACMKKLRLKPLVGERHEVL